MPWKGTSCPLAAGWQERLVTKTLTAAGLGAVAGSVLSVLQRKPLLPYVGGTAASCAICVSFFGVLQEGARVVRCADTPVNSVFAGTAASYMLISLHSGRQVAMPAALYCGLGVGGLHWLCQGQDLGAFLRRTLVRLDLLDDEDLKRELNRPVIPYDARKKEDLGWMRYLPIRKMTQEEWEQYQIQKKERFRERLRAAHAGGIAGIVDVEQTEPSSEDSSSREAQLD